MTATGARTKFGRTAELIRGAGAESSAQKAIFRVVHNLVIFNGGVTVLLAAYALHLWSSRPGAWLLSSSSIDGLLFAILATRGLLMAPLPLWIAAALAAAAALLAFVLDAIKRSA